MWRNSIALRTVASTVASIVFSIGNASAAAHEQVLYTFDAVPHGGTPAARLIADTDGNLYGTTFNGGANQNGCVFELSRDSDGSWTETVLYSFTGPDGSGPSSSLVFDSAGNLYGTTTGGGAHSTYGGVAFELTPSDSGEWTETVLHSFGNSNDGTVPRSELIRDAHGNLYGTTEQGGTMGGGTVYRLSPGENAWTETVLHNFGNSISGPDGDSPGGGLVIDKKGNLYGVTQSGGAYGWGSVYKLARATNGNYTESLIHSFNITDGLQPDSTLVFDAAGNLYGTTFFGGNTKVCNPYGCGTVFELKKNSEDNWTAVVLHELNGKNGYLAVGPVAFDCAGNLYAAAQSAGPAGWGSIYKLIRGPNTPWAERMIHAFHNNPDGASPYAGVTTHSCRNLFGTTSGGGGLQWGVVFEIKP